MSRGKISKWAGVRFLRGQTSAVEIKFVLQNGTWGYCCPNQECILWHFNQTQELGLDKAWSSTTTLQNTDVQGIFWMYIRRLKYTQLWSSIIVSINIFKQRLKSGGPQQHSYLTLHHWCGTLHTNYQVTSYKVISWWLNNTNRLPLAKTMVAKWE